MNTRAMPTRSDARRVAVIGASGHTGRFVVNELLHRGMEPIAVGRDVTRLNAAGFHLNGVPTAVASLDNSADLDRALAGTCAVVNCAGPFLDTAAAVTTAAMRNRVHYLDITAEQASAQALFDRFDNSAPLNGIVVLPAMGFYGGLVDLLATATVGDWLETDEILVRIALDRWYPTEGTRRTGRRNTARRLMIADGALTPLPHPSPTTSWGFPAPFGHQDMVEVPLSETVLITRHLDTVSQHTFINQAPLRDLEDPSTPPPTAADETGRSSQRFLVEVAASNGDQKRTMSVRGRDIYATTAPLVGEAVERILDGAVSQYGAGAPGELFNANAFLNALSPEHLVWNAGQV